MNRRDFIKNSLFTATSLSAIPVLSACQSFPDLPSYILPNYKKADPLVEKRFKDTMNFLIDNNWATYIKTILDIDLPKLFSYEYLASEEIHVNRDLKGLDDFAGNKWIEPGNPAKSLLYHLMASPRIQHELIKAYPDLEHLDYVENFIYEIARFNEETIGNRQTLLMVLSFEYRPAYQTPTSFSDSKVAQMVYSKSGVARIGTHKYNYCSKYRCFTNKPKAQSDVKSIAVFPARFALFEVELVKATSNQIRIMNKTTSEYIGNWLSHNDRYFINPIRKICSRTNFKIRFSHYHRNEKLSALSKYSYDDKTVQMYPDNLRFDQPPFVRISSSRSDGFTYKTDNSDIDMVQLDKAGNSSILLVPAAEEMVREARQNGERVLIKVPKHQSWNTHTNRRYAAMKLPNEEGNEFWNVISTDLWGRIFGKRVYSIRDPKNAPQFLNIKFEYDEKSNSIKHIDGSLDINDIGSFDKKIEEGEYYAQVFEDSICDGCVTAEIIDSNDQLADNRIVAPALSFVTAPDFFELVDSNDIRSVFPKDNHFFEGGTLNLSTVRMRGNPNIINPITTIQAFKEFYYDDKSFDTNLAVVAVNHTLHDDFSEKKHNDKERQVTWKRDIDERFQKRQNRDYRSTSFLPDTGTGIFYPAWDITYSNDKLKSTNHFLATIGLGSPFPEDMKLCAAANGMWPVTSPDAGRTYQGSLDYIGSKRPNTSIPLLDSEIGYNSLSPYVIDHGGKTSFGWDGEQGPFIEFNYNDIAVVNYTDIARADYIFNLLKGPGFDMSKLRELDVDELVCRMDSLKNCIKALENRKVWNSKLWLISATTVPEWKDGVIEKTLPKSNKIPFEEAYYAQSEDLAGKGYLFVFAKVPKNKNGADSKFDHRDTKRKRRQIICEEIWACQSSPDKTVFKQFVENNQRSHKWVTISESNVKDV